MSSHPFYSLSSSLGSVKHKSAAVEAGAVAENQALKLSAVDDDIMIEFQAFSVISAVVPTTTE